jgi:hypothetical protein
MVFIVAWSCLISVSKSVLGDARSGGTHVERRGGAQSSVVRRGALCLVGRSESGAVGEGGQRLALEVGS